MQILNTTSQNFSSPPAPRASSAVLEVMENLVRIGRKHGGLWPSCLDLDSHEMPSSDPGLLHGQRQWDRAIAGCNLMHDIPLLGLSYAVADALGRADFRDAANGYLEAFTSRCTETETGLFPWGEHAFWNLRNHSAGNSITEAGILSGKSAKESSSDLIHDHLRQAPAWFWSSLANFSPSAVQRFAGGLDRHWVTEERDEYNRHAIADGMSRLGRVNRSCDFPRHSGFYILDLACAYQQHPRQNTLLQIERFADYWWGKREEGEPLYIESRSPTESSFHKRFCPSQTLSLGVSLLEAAELLRDSEPDLCRELGHRGKTYCRAFLKAPHGSDSEVFVSGYYKGARDSCRFLPVFSSVYGTYPVAQAGVICCAAYRHLGDHRFLQQAERGARACFSNLAVLRNTAPPALDAGLALELLADLYDITREKEWLELGRAMWPVIWDRYFCNGLVRAAAGQGWYEAQQGSGYLLHGAMRFGLFEESPHSRSIPPDYSAR